MIYFISNEMKKFSFHRRSNFNCSLTFKIVKLIHLSPHTVCRRCNKTRVINIWCFRCKNSLTIHCQNKNIRIDLTPKGQRPDSMNLNIPSPPPQKKKSNKNKSCTFQDEIRCIRLFWYQHLPTLDDITSNYCLKIWK